jgi:hypothetical protein
MKYRPGTQDTFQKPAESEITGEYGIISESAATAGCHPS